MDDLTDFLEDFLKPEKPERDGSGRPLLVKAPHTTGLCSACADLGFPDQHRAAYTRASGLGDLLEEFSFLWKWKMRGLAVGLAQSMDLVRLAAAETYTCGFTDDVQANRASGRRVDEIIERALDRAGVDMKADYGTAVHARTEPENDAVGIDPDEMQAMDVASCWDLWAELGIVNIGTEIFTANDELMSAGTFDHLSYVPGYGIIVTDKKTSAKAKASYDIQLASYSRSDVYDPETDERQTLEEYAAAAGWDPALINRSVGLIWWIKNGKTEARFLDLDKGYEAAKIAAWIRDERRPLGVAKNVTADIRRTVSEQRDTLLTRIAQAPTLEALYALHANPAAQAIWTPTHTEAATARKEAL